MKVGDKVLWRGSFGVEAPQEATIVELELCEYPREKYGTPVDEIDWNMKDYAVVTLDNGHWAYGEQLSPLR